MVKQASLSLFHDSFFTNTIHREIAASVVFGQTSMSCRGSGICRVDMAVSQKEDQSTVPDDAWVCKSYNVQFRRSYSGRLMMRIMHTTTDDYLMRKQFANGRFLMNEDYVLPEWVVNRLKLDTDRIPAGKYAYTQDEI
ncbi:MAG: hypothetical protein AAF242_09020, partial [Bacteroidota bacterium]